MRVFTYRSLFLWSISPADTQTLRFRVRNFTTEWRSGWLGKLIWELHLGNFQLKPYFGYLYHKKLPQLEKWTIERLDYDLEWLWCSFLLLLSICDDSDDLDKYFELALRLVPAEYSI